MLVPKGILVDSGTETPGELYALRNPLSNDKNHEEHGSLLIPVEYRDTDVKATQMLNHAEVEESDKSKLNED